MSNKKYKAVLLVFAGLFVLSIVLDHYFDTSFLSIIGIVRFSSVILLWLSLFFFLLYAENKIKTDDKDKLAPSKLLPMVTFLFIFITIGYAISMSIVYIEWQSLTGKGRGSEDIALCYKEISLDDEQSAGKRLDTASQYYIYYGGNIYYLDEKNQKKLYTPDESTTKERMKNIKAKEDSRFLKIFMFSSAIISLLSGVIVTIFYLRHRKAKILRHCFRTDGNI